MLVSRYLVVVEIAGSKNVAVAGTPELLAADQACGEGVIIEAKATNTGNVYIFPADGAKTDVKPLETEDFCSMECIKLKCA